MDGLIKISASLIQGTWRPGLNLKLAPDSLLRNITIWPKVREDSRTRTGEHVNRY